MAVKKDDEVVETSIVEDMEAAFDEANTGQDSSEESEEVSKLPEGDGDGGEETGGEAAAEEAEASEGGEDGDGGAEEPKEEPAAEDEASAGDNAEGDDGIKPPVGLGAVAREGWSKVPKAVKEYIQKREQEVATTMQGTAEARRTHEAMSGIIGNYRQVLAAEGAQNPLEAINNIINTVSVLRMGSPQQKAAQLAALVGHYNVGIEDLDSALAGSVGGGSPATGAADPSIEAMLDERMAPVNNLINQLATHQQNQQTTNAQQTQQAVQNFAADPKNEFFNDVRGDMADLFDVASAQGKTITIEQAYEKACKMNDSVQSVLSSRAEQERIVNATKAAADKAAASSSVSSVNTREPARNTTGNDLLADLNDAWDAHTG